MNEKIDKNKKDIYNPWGNDASEFMLPNGSIATKGTRKYRKIMKKWKKQQKKKERSS